MDGIASQLRESRAYETSPCVITASADELVISRMYDGFSLRLYQSCGRYRAKVYRKDKLTAKSEWLDNGTLATALRDLLSYIPALRNNHFLILALAEILQHRPHDFAA